MVTQEYLKLSQAAAYCGITKRTLRHWLEDGLKSAKVGGVVLVRKAWLDQYIKQYCRELGMDLDKVVDGVIREFRGR